MVAGLPGGREAGDCSLTINGMAWQVTIWQTTVARGLCELVLGPRRSWEDQCPIDGAQSRGPNRTLKIRLAAVLGGACGNVGHGTG